MTNKTFSRFPVPDIRDVPPDIRERILAVQAKSGFVPNVFLALAHRPEEFRAFFAFHDAVMEKESGISKAERELIVNSVRRQDRRHIRTATKAKIVSQLSSADYASVPQRQYARPDGVHVSLGAPVRRVIGVVLSLGWIVLLLVPLLGALATTTSV